MPPVVAGRADGTQVRWAVRPASLDLNHMVGGVRHKCAARQLQLAHVAVSDQHELADGSPGCAMITRVGWISLFGRWLPSRRVMLGWAVRQGLLRSSPVTKIYPRSKLQKLPQFTAV
jgi:hypothetical protein